MKFSEYISVVGQTAESLQVLYIKEAGYMYKHEGRIANAAGLTREQYLEFEYIVGEENYVAKLAALVLAERVKKGLVREDLGFDELS